MKLKCTAISDLHNTFPEDLEGGDILLIGGDLTNRGTDEELVLAEKWITKQKEKYKYILFTPGNHDLSFEADLLRAEKLLGVKAYINEVVEIDGVKFFLSPYSVQFGDWAFMKPDYSLANTVSSWPLDIDVAMVHGPAKYLRDKVGHHGDHVGSDAIKWWLNKAIDQGQIKLFICGHIHESFGGEKYRDMDVINVAQGASLNWTLNQYPVYFTIDTQTKEVEYYS